MHHSVNIIQPWYITKRRFQFRDRHWIVLQSCIAKFFFWQRYLQKCYSGDIILEVVLTLAKVTTNSATALISSDAFVSSAPKTTTTFFIYS